MVPPLIVERAQEAGLNMLAVTDHNSGENAAAVVAAAEGTGMVVFPGMEMETREGVHVIALFDAVPALLSWQEQVYRALPDRANDAHAFGAQLVVDSGGDLLRTNHRLLITGVSLTLAAVVEIVHRLGGTCIPAHVDRPSSGLLGVLGFAPTDLDVPALEISPRLTPTDAAARFPQLAGRTLVRSSDAHRLEDIGRVFTTFQLSEASLPEVARALRGEEGRMVVTESCPIH